MRASVASSIRRLWRPVSAIAQGRLTRVRVEPGVGDRECRLGGEERRDLALLVGEIHDRARAERA